MGQERWFYLGSLSLVVAGCGCVGCVGRSGWCEAHVLELDEGAVIVLLAALLKLEAQDDLFALELRQQGDELLEGGLLATAQELGCYQMRMRVRGTRSVRVEWPSPRWRRLRRGWDDRARPIRRSSGNAVHTGDGLTDGRAEANLEATTVADVRGIGRSEGGLADLLVEQAGPWSR
jgi:hypothetical protein